MGPGSAALLLPTVPAEGDVPGTQYLIGPKNPHTCHSFIYKNEGEKLSKVFLSLQIVFLRYFFVEKYLYPETFSETIMKSQGGGPYVQRKRR